MNIRLKGSPPACLTTGILLLSKARTFGQPISILIEGNKQSFGNWTTATLAFSPVMAAVGFPTGLHPEVIVLGGPSLSPLHIRIHDKWIQIGRTGIGTTPISKAIVNIYRQSDRSSQNSQTMLNQFFVRFGIPKEPSVIELLTNDQIPIKIRFQLLKALRLTFGISWSQPQFVNHLFSFDAEKDISEQWPLQEAAMQEVMGEAFISLIQTNFSNTDLCAQIQQCCLEWGQHITIPQENITNVPEWGHIIRSFPTAIGKTATHHPLDLLQNKFVTLGGSWSQTNDQSIIVGANPKCLENQSELDWVWTESHVAYEQTERLWRRVMGKQR